jgi:hypothetical protein
MREKFEIISLLCLHVSRLLFRYFSNVGSPLLYSELRGSHHMGFMHAALCV